jgi:hypothetical protein
LHVFIEKQVKSGRRPAGELFKSVGGRIILHYDDYMLMRIVKAVLSRSLCSKSHTSGKTSKEVACSHVDRLKVLLAKIKRPYFFGDKVIHPWKYVEEF